MPKAKKPNKPIPVWDIKAKPKQILKDKHYLLVSYGDFDIRQNPYHIPETFINFSTGNLKPPENDTELHPMIIDVFQDFATDTDYFHHNPRIRPIHLYYMEFEDLDEMMEMEDLISEISQSPLDTPCISRGNYIELTDKLPKFKEVEIRVEKIAQ